MLLPAQWRLLSSVQHLAASSLLVLLTAAMLLAVSTVLTTAYLLAIGTIVGAGPALFVHLQEQKAEAVPSQWDAAGGRGPASSAAKGVG